MRTWARVPIHVFAGRNWRATNWSQLEITTPRHPADTWGYTTYINYIRLRKLCRGTAAAETSKRESKDRTLFWLMDTYDCSQQHRTYLSYTVLLPFVPIIRVSVCLPRAARPHRRRIYSLSHTLHLPFFTLYKCSSLIAWPHRYSIIPLTSLKLYLHTPALRYVIFTQSIAMLRSTLYP